MEGRIKEVRFEGQPTKGLKETKVKIEHGERKEEEQS